MNAKSGAIVLVSGGATGLGRLVQDAYVDCLLEAEIVDVYSNHVDRICADTLRALDRFGIRVVSLPAVPTAEDEEQICEAHPDAWWILAGYTRRLRRYPRGKTINIHPGPTESPFGGKGMYGQRVHERVLASGRPETAVTIHFVNDLYDRGSIIFQCPVPVMPGDTPESLQRRVNAQEHYYYGRVLNRVLKGSVQVTVEEFASPLPRIL